MEKSGVQAISQAFEKKTVAKRWVYVDNQCTPKGMLGYNNPEGIEED